MKKAFSILIFCLPILSKAQGIKFESDLNWNEVYAKARAENKFIFVDCYATWCAPCKEMDKNIYPLKEVGDKFNPKFVSVKVQMDKTSTDNTQIKEWYDQVELFKSLYSVSVCPTYLFFSTNGRIVHKATSLKDMNAFISIAEDALNPEKQYYTLLQNFKPGTLDTAEMKSLATVYLRQRKNELAEKIVLDYYNRIPHNQRFNLENLKFLEGFTASSKVNDIAYEYLKGLKKSEFAKRENENFAISFGNTDKRVRELCISYIKGLNPKEFKDTNNLKFIAALNPLPEIQEMAIPYIEGLSSGEISKKQNIRFITRFSKHEKVESIANKYISTLSGNDLDEFYKIEFIQTFTKTSKDPGFLLFYRFPDKIVATLIKANGANANTAFANAVVDYIISQEEISPLLKVAKDANKIPDWVSISEKIKNKYNNAVVERTILPAKVGWYKSMKDWPNYIKHSIELMTKKGIDTIGAKALLETNNFCWYTLFMHSTDAGQLDTGIKWMEKVVRNNPKDHGMIDTYANLLYKAGRKAEAIDWETKALGLSFGNKSIQETLDKMKNNLPTWTGD